MKFEVVNPFFIYLNIKEGYLQQKEYIPKKKIKSKLFSQKI